MMKVVFTLALAIGLAAPVLAQGNYKVSTTTQAEYPDGDKALYMMMMKSIHYPDSAIEAKVQGIVQVSYMVEPDGSVSEPQVIQSLSPAIDQEVLRIVRGLTFSPAKANGTPVRSNRIDNFQVYAREW